MRTPNQEPPRTAPALYPELGANTSDRACSELPVSGALPAPLRGVLYRNGPGLFRRHGRHKGSVLDGDGVLQRLELDGGRARYTRRFVRTPKFEAEEAAGRFLWKTWTTRAPGLWRNPGQRVPSQAGVTTYCINGALYALDEVAPAFEIDPESLATRGPASLGLPAADEGLKAHARYLADSGDWLFLATRFGPGGMSITIVRHRADGRRVATPSVPAPRMAYLHDFAVTDRHAVVILQPAILRPLRFLSGLRTFAPAPGSSAADAGWLITQILDTRRGASAFAVFDARAVAAGPIARVQLDEALPLSFHSHWASR